MLSGCLKQQPIVVGACLSWWKRLMLMKKQFRNSTPSTSRGYYRQYLLPHCFFPHLWHTFFAEDCGFFKNNIQTSRKVTLSLLCDAVNGHLVKVTSHFRLSDEAISGRHQGLFCPNLLAGNLMGTKKKTQKMGEKIRILGTSLQVYTYRVGWRMQYVQSQFWCFFSHKPATKGILTPRLQIFLECLQLFTLVLRDSGWKSTESLIANSRSSTQ